MKKYIYMAMACLTMGLASCSNDPEDAVSKHVYGPDENPYLRADETATISTKIEFRKGHIAPKTIYLKEHAETIQKKLGMTVDDMLAGLESGKVVFYNINTNKRAWDKTAPNNGTGWNYSRNGAVTASDVAGTIVLDKSNKSLVVSCPEDSQAGINFVVNLGFAIDNGRDYDTYVRFSIELLVGDPGLVSVSINIPEGDYAAGEVDFTKYPEAIEKCLDMTVDEFCSEIQDPDGALAMYLVDDSGNWDTTSSYTANGIGYWCTSDGKVTNWGTDACQYFIETWETSVGIGRYPGVASGTTNKCHFVYAKKADYSKYVEFLVNMTFQ